MVGGRGGEAKVVSMDQLVGLNIYNRSFGAYTPQTCVYRVSFPLQGPPPGPMLLVPRLRSVAVALHYTQTGTSVTHHREFEFLKGKNRSPGSFLPGPWGEESGLHTLGG